jgi:putative DNA primase/helicase
LIDFNDTMPLGREPHRYDLDEIVRRLRETAADWVPRHFPNGRRVGDEWRLANIRGDAPRKQGSCVITLKGEHAGDWIDFDGNAGGGPLSALENATGLSGRALYAYAAELVGWTPGKPPVRSNSPVPSARPAADRTQDVAREIGFILSRAEPITGSPVGTYLASRGLAVPETPDLLSHPDVTYWDTKTGHPAMVAIVRDVGGERTAIHRTYLRADGSGKADVPKPRMMLGPVAGGTVRLGESGDGGVIGIAEGIETALSAMQACPHLPAWATLSAPNLEQVVLPEAVRRVVILADHDPSGAGLRAAHRAARRFHGEGRRVWIAMPPSEDDDFNDVLRRDGPDAVRTMVEAAEEWAPGVEIESEGSETDMGSHRPVGFIDPDGRLPRMRTDDGDLARATNRAWDLLLAANTPPWLFRSGGWPSWIERDDDGRPMPKPVNDNRLRHVLAQLAIWERASRTGDLVPAHPPVSVIKDILATPNPALPVLAGIVTAPVFGGTGELLTEPGYHPAARLLYEPPKGFSLPAIPDKPTPSDVEAARSLLLDEFLGDFPFTGEAERAHALALLLVGFVRSMIEGPTPLHLIEKPTPGTGATLMVDAISIVTTGSSASIMVEGRDDEEWRKRLTAKLRQIPSVVFIDNLRRRLDSSAVAAALTAPFWEDRVLGTSETTRFPIRCTWIATGNNPEFSNEMARRIVRIRLDARVDQPWRREGFRLPNLLAWVRANRARLVAACLTLGRAWIAAGMPRHKTTIGSFESWAEVIGGILDVAGVPGFLTNLDDMLEAADADGAMWRLFIAQWWDRFGSAEVGTGDLYELAANCEPPLPLGTGGERSQRTRLGKALGRMRDRVFVVGGLQLRLGECRELKRAKQWRLYIQETTGEPGERCERFPVPDHENKGERGERFPGSFSERVNVGERFPGPDHKNEGERGERSKQRSPQRSPEIHQQNQNAGERCERCERFSIALPRADARPPARTKETPGKRSPCSQRSPTLEKSTGCEGERGGERWEQRSPASQDPSSRWEEVI